MSEDVYEAAVFAAADEARRSRKGLLFSRPSRPDVMNPPAAIDRAVDLVLSGTSCVIDGRVLERAALRLQEAVSAANPDVIPVVIGDDRDTGIVDLFVRARDNGLVSRRPAARAVAIVTDFESCPGHVLAELDGQEVPFIGVLGSSRILVSPLS